MVIHKTQPYPCFHTSRRITINSHKTIKTKCYTQHIILDNQTMYKSGRTYNHCSKISYGQSNSNNDNNKNNNNNKTKQ